jgi:hypothetical protein
MEAVHRTVHPSLDLIPRGISALPVGSERELHFPGALLAEYGCVLMGTSAQAAAFAAMAGRCADAVVLAVRRQGAQREGLQQAAAALRSAGATLAGCIVLD